MTAKQRQARAKFKAVVKEAAKLRKKNPKLTQAQAVKQAFAISYSKERKGEKLGAVKKKSATKVKATKRKGTEMHTDTKSHNVNIRVVSGISFSKDEIIFLEKEGKKSKGYKYRAKILWGSPIVLKETKNGTPVQKFIVDNLNVAQELANELNKGQKLYKIKGKNIV